MKKIAVIFLFLVLLANCAFAADSPGQPGIETDTKEKTNQGGTNTEGTEETEEETELVVTESTGELLTEEAAEVVQEVNSMLTSTEGEAPNVKQVIERLATGFLVEIPEATQPQTVVNEKGETVTTNTTVDTQNKNKSTTTTTQTVKDVAGTEVKKTTQIVEEENNKTRTTQVVEDKVDGITTKLVVEKKQNGDSTTTLELKNDKTNTSSLLTIESNKNKTTITITTTDENGNKRTQDLSDYSFVTGFADVVEKKNGITTDSAIQDANLYVTNLVNFTESQVQDEYKVMLIGTDGKVYFIDIKGFDPVTGKVIADLPCKGSIAIVKTN
jgi:hypothetical protein